MYPPKENPGGGTLGFSGISPVVKRRQRRPGPVDQGFLGAVLAPSFVTMVVPSVPPMVTT